LDTKDSSGKIIPTSGSDTSWKIPDPAMDGVVDRTTRPSSSKPTAAVSGNDVVQQPVVAAAASVATNVESVEEISSRVPLVALIVLLLVLLLGGVGAIVYLKRPDLLGSKPTDEVPSVTARWIEDKTATERFAAEWSRARVLQITEVGQFIEKFWQLQSAYIKDPYSQDQAEVEQHKTDLFKEFVRGGLIAIEIPFTEFFSGEVSPNTQRYTVKLTSDQKGTGDGGVVFLRGLLSLKLPSAVSQLNLTPSAGSGEPDRVRLLLSVYHAEPRSETRSVRPMELPADLRRYDAINAFVTLTEADGLLSADLIGIASMDSKGQQLVAKMKGYVLPEN